MAEDFSRHIARVVASQIAEATGFDACQDSAIEILGDLLLRYLATVCTSSHSYAELAGRTQSNLADVLLALEDLGVTPEDLHHHMQLQATDVPFAHTLAPFPVHTQQALPPSFADQQEPNQEHIPKFLPAFPDPHTYQHTPAYAGHQTDPHKQRQSMLEAKQKSEAALHKLHQRISSKTSQPDTNPFLAAPTMEQLQLQLPQLPAPAAAAAAAAAAVAAADGDAGDGALANGPFSSSSKHPPTNNTGQGAAAGDGSSSQQMLKQQQHPLPFLRQQQLAAAAAAGAEDELDEDLLFESAAVLKAFSSVLPPDLLAQHTQRLQGADEQEAQRSKQRPSNGAADASNGVYNDDIVIEEEGASGMDIDGSDAAAGVVADTMQQQQHWLAWDPQQDLQQQQLQQDNQQQPSALLGPTGAVGPQLLKFGIDPLAAGKSAATRLAGRHRPADAFAERNSSKAGGGAAAAGGACGSGSGRQRKSKYDADPSKQRAEGILAANPEALYPSGTDGRLLEVFGDLEDS